MDKIGPICRSAEDCGLVLRAIAGGDNNDPASSGKSFYFAPQFTREMKDVKVGYAPVDFHELVDPSTREAFGKALEVLRSIGVEMVETALPDLPYGALTSTIISAEGASSFEPLITSGKVDELADKRQAEGLKAALEIPARDYLKAMRIRRIVQQEMRKVLTDFDVILAPSRYTVAPKINEPLDRSLGLGEGKPPASPGMRPLIPAGNLAGLPGVSLPCGLVNNLPIAISLVSRPFTENLILSIGNEFQKRTDWHRRHPNVS